MSQQHPKQSPAESIAANFMVDEQILSVQPVGSGLVNDTFLVECRKRARSFILQRLSPNVFQNPAGVMQNLRVLSDHFRQHLNNADSSVTGWRMPFLLPTVTGEDFCCDAKKHTWRAMEYIDGTTTYDSVTSNKQARQAGRALGIFHGLTADFAPEKLTDTLPGFHITTAYHAQYESVLRQSTVQTESEAVTDCLQFISKRETHITVLEEAGKNGILNQRVMHGDPKINNILFDEDSLQAVSMIDLDTVKPGLIHYDIGDILRSCCNPAGEEPEDIATVGFSLTTCRNLLSGYFAEKTTKLSSAEQDLIYEAVRLIALELGLRFFTDYLAGDVYFKTRYPEHNLYRARVQFALCASIEAQEHSIRQVVRDCAQAAR